MAHSCFQVFPTTKTLVSFLTYCGIWPTPQDNWVGLPPSVLRASVPGWKSPPCGLGPCYRGDLSGGGEWGVLSVSFISSFLQRRTHGSQLPGRPEGVLVNETQEKPNGRGRTSERLSPQSSLDVLNGLHSPSAAKASFLF